MAGVTLIHLLKLQADDLGLASSRRPGFFTNRGEAMALTYSFTQDQRQSAGQLPTEPGFASDSSHQPWGRLPDGL